MADKAESELGPIAILHNNAATKAVISIAFLTV
jgi:hypothetical protein